MIIKDTIINLKLVTHIHKEDKVVTDFGKYVGTSYLIHIHYVSGKSSSIEYNIESFRDKKFIELSEIIKED